MQIDLTPLGRLIATTLLDPPRQLFFSPRATSQLIRINEPPKIYPATDQSVRVCPTIVTSAIAVVLFETIPAGLPSGPGDGFGSVLDWGVASMEAPSAKPHASKSNVLAAARCEEILDAATTLFAEQGYSDAVTQDLVERLGVGKGTLYRYYPSKRELFLAAVDRVMWRMRSHVESEIAEIVEPFERLEEALRAYLDFFGQHPEYVELLVQERALFRDRKTPTYFEHRERNIVSWHAMLKQLMLDGRVREIPVERITNVMFNAVYGIMFTNYFTGPSRSTAEQARDILDIVRLGILTDDERKARCSTFQTSSNSSAR